MTFKKGKSGFWKGKKRPYMKEVKEWNRTGKSPWNKGKKFPELSKENHPNWTGKYAKVHICEFCNNTFKTKKYNNQRFCSRKCQYDWMSKNGIVRGKNNGMWNGGKSKERHDWIFKEKISPMLRSVYPCSICGSREKLVVHHIDEDKHNNALDNLIVLCLKHHTQIHTELRKLK